MTQPQGQPTTNSDDEQGKAQINILFQQKPITL